VHGVLPSDRPGSRFCVIHDLRQWPGQDIPAAHLRVYPGMKPRTLAAAIAVALSLAACGHATAPPSAAATPTPAVAATHADVPLTCKQQADRWKHRNIAVLRRFKAALGPFTTGTVTSAQAHTLARTAQAAEDVPPPACADPKGYYGRALAELVTAGTAAGGGGSLAELGALVPMENALTALSQLSTELLRTIGGSKL